MQNKQDGIINGRINKRQKTKHNKTKEKMREKTTNRKRGERLLKRAFMLCDQPDLLTHNCWSKVLFTPV